MDVLKFILEFLFEVHQQLVHMAIPCLNKNKSESLIKMEHHEWITAKL